MAGKKIIKYLIIAILCILSNRIYSQELLAGSGKIDITPTGPNGGEKWLLGYPARKSTEIHDHIFQRMMILDDGHTQFILVSTDICVLNPLVTEEVENKVKAQSTKEGVNREIEFWWATTHTHSAPEVGPAGLDKAFLAERYDHAVDEPYTKMVENSIVDKIKEVRKHLKPAKIGFGWGYSSANMNRRAVFEDGQARLGMNPDKPVDRKIGLIRVDGLDGSRIGLLTNYPMHGTVLGGSNTLISGDAPGVVAEYVEKKIGVPMLYLNGAAGNMAPLYSVYNSSPGFTYLDQFKVLLGDKVVEAYNKIKTFNQEFHFSTGRLTIETPRREGLGWPKELSKFSKTLNNGENMVELPIRFFKFNDDNAMWSAPVEMFCEIPMEVREKSPFENTFYVGYCNGWLGYLPTKESFKEGGYEINTVSPFTPSVQKDVTDGVLSFLEGDLLSK